MSSYNVKINRGSRRKITAIAENDVNINVNTTETNTVLLASLDDIDVFGREEGYILMWNSQRNVHEYVSPYEVVDRADSNTADYSNEPQDPSVAQGDDAIDYGVF